MHEKRMGHEYSSDLQTNLCYLLKARIKTILNNEIELKMKHPKGRSVLMENFMNGYFKSEWTKIVLCFLLTKVNIWKSGRIMLMNFSPGFLITTIHIPDPDFIYVINSSLVNFTSTQKFSLHCMVLLPFIRSCNKYISTWPQSPPITIFGVEICINTSVLWKSSGKKRVQ